MYNLLAVFCFVVNFPAIPVFVKKIRIARAGKNFSAKKMPAFFFSREKKIRAVTRTHGNAAVHNPVTNNYFPGISQRNEPYEVSRSSQNRGGVISFPVLGVNAENS